MAIHASYRFEDSDQPLHGVQHFLCSGNEDNMSPGVTLDYVAEGAANVIWSLGTEPRLRKKLLRIRKGTWAGDGEPPRKGAPPPFLSASHVLELFDLNIRPLFRPGQLVEQELVKLQPDLFAQFNARLDALEQEQKRPPPRYGWHLQDGERYGLLITSMLPTSANTALFQLKPKWLAQSPNAPPNARRCRTCALAAKRRTPAHQLFCPLALISGSVDVVRKQIANRVKAEVEMSRDLIGRRPTIYTGDDDLDDYSEPPQALMEDFVNLFTLNQAAHNVLVHLRELQLRFDPAGVLEMPVAADRADLSMAMTLRDATMFIKLGPKGADVRLGDLDPKSGDSEGKLQDWANTEKALIEDGWYEGRERTVDGKLHDSCWLWKIGSWT